MRSRFLLLFWLVFTLNTLPAFCQQPTQQELLEQVRLLDGDVLEKPNSQNYYLRGFTKAKIRDMEAEAMRDYDKAIELDPKSFEAYFSRGMLKERLEDYKSAIADYDMCIALNPRSYKALFNVAYCKSMTDDGAGAIAGYTRCIGMDPMNKMAYINRGYLYYHGNQFKEALADFNIALTLDPSDSELYLSRALAKAFLKDRTALTDFNNAVKMSPNDPETYFNRALYFINFKIPNADYCADLKKALQLGLDQAATVLSEKCNKKTR